MIHFISKEGTDVEVEDSVSTPGNLSISSYKGVDYLRATLDYNQVKSLNHYLTCWLEAYNILEEQK